MTTPSIRSGLPGAGRGVRTGAFRFLIAVAALSAAGCGKPEPPAPAIQSVVLIGVDTLRADHLGTYGAERALSPTLDRIADRGRVFEHAYATSAWTLPSFASLLTGLDPSEHGAGILVRHSPDVEWDPNRVVAKGRSKLNPEVTTLAERLAAGGFATLAVVQTPNLNAAYEVDRGFDTYDNSTRGRGRVASQAIARALQLVDKHKDGPFFLFLHLIDPHLSYHAPAPFGGTFTEDIDADLELPIKNIRELRRTFPEYSPAEKRFVVAAYDEEIAYIDAQLASLMEGLSERGIRDTLFVLTSDHGEEFLEHGGFEHGHSLYQEIVRVPMLIWGPGITAGREAAPVSIADIAPTILEAAGLPGNATGFGQTLWPSLVRDQPIPADRLIVAVGTLYGPNQRMAVRWPYKLVQCPETGESELFHLEQDPEERHDLSATRTEIVEQLSAELDARLTKSSAPGEEALLDDEAIESLRALGYVDSSEE